MQRWSVTGHLLGVSRKSRAVLDERTPVDLTDPSEFELIYRQHATVVFSHFRQRGVTPTDAEDLTGEVFAIAWRRAADVRIDPDAGALPWLLVTANNLMRGQARSRIRAQRAWTRWGQPEDAPDFSISIADAAEQDFRLALLVEVMSGLTVAEQEVLQLCALRGLSPTVVAAQTGEPAGTVRSRLSRATAKARQRYQQLTATDAVEGPRR